MSPAATASRPHGALTWRPTKIMHIQDLPKDDDFLSHLLIEKLGTSTVPLLVHKMDSSRRLPKTNSSDIMRIVRRVRSLSSPVAAFLFVLKHQTYFHATLCSMLSANFQWRRPSSRQLMNSYCSFTTSLLPWIASNFWHLSRLTILPASQTPLNTLFSKELYSEANKCFCHVGRVTYVLRRPSFLMNTSLDIPQDISNYTILQDQSRSHTHPVTHTAPENLNSAYSLPVISLLTL